MSDIYNYIREALKKRKTQNRYRTLKPIKYSARKEPRVTLSDGRSMLNFCSNDYLGLANHSYLIEKAEAFTREFGTGATASRLICGDYTCHEELEEKLAEWLGHEAAILFNTGFQANTTILSTLANRNATIIADKLSHNSIIQGALLSNSRMLRYHHNDLNHLEELLKRERDNEKQIIIVSETVFSMDGDRCDVDGLGSLADRYEAALYLDEAHAIGILGKQGKGLADGYDQVDFKLGTFGKAFGSMGAFMSGRVELREYLINYCPGFIFSTALAPSIVGALSGALDLIPDMKDERENVATNAQYLRNSLQEIGFDTGPSESQIIPVIIGTEEETLKLSAFLEDNEILATAIRPPTVPRKSSRIRLTLTAKHNKEHIDYLIDVFKKWKES